MGNSVPRGWFIGRAASREEEEPQAAATEPKPAITQTPASLSSLFALLLNIVTWLFDKQDYFVRTPENLRLQASTAAADPAQPAGELKKSRSFMGLYSCKSSGSTKQESRVLPTSCTGVNACNMENKRNRTSDNPRKLPFKLIKRITNNFSEELGRGAFGQVFKGVLEGGEEVAVKMLRSMPQINDKQFENEFEILKRLNHPNIVRLVAFCDEDQEVCMEYKGKRIVCYRIHRALCLEYVPNGSLGKLLKGENLGKNWPIRYKIIKGICEGLQYLREGLECPIFHFDLKPDNILLNEEMVPKISDFGLSRLIGEENTKRTLTPLGTPGYLPPEFINHQVISKEYDIYSLGVIITKIITGITGYSDVADMGAQEFVEHVHENWKKYLQEIPNYASLEVDCKQVKRCIKIARRCMETYRHKRPTIKDIMSQLDDDMGDIIILRSETTVFRRRRMVMPHLYTPQERSDGETSYIRTEAASIPHRQPVRSMHKEPSRMPVTKCIMRLRVTESSRLPRHKPVRSMHKLKLTDIGVTPFTCDGCKEPGYGRRYYARDCGGGSQSLDLHMRCALADDPLFGLHTLVLPLFGYGKQFEFRFLHEPPPPAEGRSRRVCDACGEATRGYVYHCCSEQDLDLHPCCASLPDRIIHDGRAFDLHRRASRPCALCPDNEGQRRWFWAYRCHVDGEAVDLHVACLKETARRSLEACYSDWPDVIGDGILENMFSSSIRFDKFGEIAGTVASFITALVFGKLIVKL